MGQEKHSSKGGVGGFLQLFDWNGKSRKKLTYNKLDFPEGTKQGKRSNENLPMTRFHLMGDENGVPSVKGSSDYSCASSTTDDEGNGIRPPGVVARLMGLDSLPTSNVTEPYSTPVFKPRSLQDFSYPRKTSEFYNECQNAVSENQPTRVDSFRRRAADSRPQKVSNSSPIERFQCETLRPRSAKPHPIAQHKLLSPIKSPGFISPKNVAVIMEAAAKILEPGYRPGSRGKSPSLLGSSSIPIQVHDLKERPATSQRSSRLPETSRRTVDSSAVKYLKGQSLNKSWNGSDDIPSHQDSPNSADNHSVGLKNKGKSISLAIQAKVNVQRREGLSSSSSKSLLVQREEDEYKLKQPLKNQTTASKNTKNKSSASKASGVLRQNNQKQNCPAKKDRLSLKPSVSNQHGRQVVSGDGSSGRIKASNKPTGCSRVSKKEGSEMADLENEVPLHRTKSYPRKKRALNGDFCSEKGGFVDTDLMNRDEKPVQHSHVAINERLNQVEDSRRKGMDVISFTFTSPLTKSTTISQSSNQMAGKQNTTNICSVNSNGETSADARGKRLSSLGLNVIGGDALSILLEQKLRELTSGVESSSCFNSGKTEMITTFAPVMQDFASDFNTVGASSIEDKNYFPGHQKDELKKYFPGHQKDELVGGFSSGYSSINGQLLKVNHKFQEPEGMVDCSSSSDAGKELDFQQPSPVSIFEACFSNETFNSSESWESTNGNKISSSVQAQNLVGETCLKKILPVEAEAELSDSASSTFIGTVEREQVVGLSVSGQMRTEKQELKYVREMLQNTRLIFKDLPLSHAHELIDPRLFDRMENQKIEWRNEGDGEDSKVSRRELFDCVREFLDMKCGRYNRGGYKTWAKGVALVQKQGLAEEVCKEIMLRRNMGDWMVDELVEWDMSNHSGRWLDFQVEAFELGEEIEREILSSLVDEVIADMF
ncbi:dentin sialophosphoprotein isoform X2 [Cinnamomum micranthum f. kanehirae]|uniref:Dentin sialophosphoprotein isoform X2 n=1 Tax=Cinnamomum micranthum f. kanehirae TaxID=337451 RepID=A0A3S3P6J3_9MAGN|nr:dentin sialophosphoprotein isoform X2 [Cinnamomum micranthum f. kanehirae]